MTLGDNKYATMCATERFSYGCTFYTSRYGISDFMQTRTFYSDNPLNILLSQKAKETAEKALARATELSLQVNLKLNVPGSSGMWEQQDILMSALKNDTPKI